MRQKPIEPLSAAEFRRLLAATGSGAIGVRDRALLEVLLKAQLRIAEALSLVRSDYDSQASTLNVRRGKGSKQRLAVLHHSAEEALDAWLAEKEKRGLGDPLFCSLRGGALCRQNVRRKLVQLGRRAGVAKRLHPHGMRHSGARLLAAAGVPLNQISAQLGHSNVSTTHRYLELLHPQARIDALSKVSWG